MQASTHDLCDESADVTDVVPDRGWLRLPWGVGDVCATPQVLLHCSWKIGRAHV